MISLKQLNYALAVEKTRHFKKAAEICSVSQSALSTAISELETQLGVQIFERDAKKVLITKIGEKILARAKSIQLDIDDIHQLAKTSQSPLTYPIKLGVIPTIGPHLLPKVLPAVRQQYPELELLIYEQESEVLLKSVRDGEIDAGIIALPYATEGLHTFEFWEEDFYAVVNSADELAQQDKISTEELRQTNLLLLRDGHCLKDHAMAACGMQLGEGDKSMAGTSLYTLVQMVAGKAGTTIVPEIALDQLVYNSKELTALHLNVPSPHRTFAFVTRLNYAGVDDVQLLMKLFAESLKKKVKSIYWAL